MRLLGSAALLLLVLTSCERTTGCRGEYCGTLVIATSSEPDILLPPVTQSALSRDIHDQIFLKLADMGMSLNTIGDADFQPQLAQRWEWEDTLTLVFHLDPRAHWQDGPSVTAADVAFTFDVYNDTVVTSSPPLRYIASVTARDSATAVFKYKRRYPEAFFDAVFHMRILPSHLLSDVTRNQLRTAPFGRKPIGDGPYTFAEWQPGQSLELVADSTFFLGRPHIRRLIWSFGPDINSAVNKVVSGDADAFEFLGFGPNVQRAREAKQLTVYPYLGSTYAYVGFNLKAPDDSTHTRPHPVFGDRDVRRAMAMGVDRVKMTQNVLGDQAQITNGPVAPFMGTIWNDVPPAPAYDTVEAGRLLTARGWRDTNRDGVRDRNGKPLEFRILVNQSPIRGRFAQLIQEQLSHLGVKVEIDQVENNVALDRARAGRFDAVIQAWVTDPSPSASIPQAWTRGGFGEQNYGRYDNPAFEQALEHASMATGSPEQVKAAWRSALEIINADAPAIWLFAPTSNAAVHKRVADVRIRPDSWWALIWTWKIPPNQQIDRDRIER